MQFNKYWIFIALCIIGNIFIFVVFSHKLEGYVYDSMVTENQNVLDGLKK